jgi:type II secretory pathway pseudopilin PulG
MTGHYKRFRIARNSARGFSTLELAFAMFIILVLSSIAIPQAVTAMHTMRLKGAVTDFAGLLQVQRIRALDDDRFYSTYVLAANGANPQMAYVDIFPQNANGTSGTGGANYTGGDPLVAISQEISPQPVGAAPNTANLKLQLLPANSPVVPRDGSAAGTPVTFGPRGLPCNPQPVAGGTVCDSLGGPTAYWTFFQNNITQTWGAVTITPAGRIARWYFTGGAAGTWITY